MFTHFLCTHDLLQQLKITNPVTGGGLDFAYSASPGTLILSAFERMAIESPIAPDRNVHAGEHTRYVYPGGGHETNPDISRKLANKSHTHVPLSPRGCYGQFYSSLHRLGVMNPACTSPVAYRRR